MSPCAAPIFSAPVVGLMKPTPWVVRQIVRVLSTALPGLRFYPSWFVSGKLEPLRVTRDEEHAQRVHLLRTTSRRSHFDFSTNSEN